MQVDDDAVAWPADAVEVARVIDAWGLKGGIRVRPYADDP
jgi:16S rRNA processing protein RimM